MQGTILGLHELKKGDILLVEDCGLHPTGKKGHRFEGTHLGIAAGQAVITHRAKASSNVTHAGLYDGGISIIEASGEVGLRSAAFCIDHRGTKYQVYRFTGDPRIPEFATERAMDYVRYRNVICGLSGKANKSVGFGRYDTTGAVTSVFASSHRGCGAGKAFDKLVETPYADRGFYCSSFVVACYELACVDAGHRRIMDVDFENVSPKMLQSLLRQQTTHWKHEGNYTVGGIAS
jgi:hypothetical protein